MAPTLDRLAIDTIPTPALDAVPKANPGHPGAPMGAAPMAYVLWTRFLRHAPTHPDWPDRHPSVLPSGHGPVPPPSAPSPAAHVAPRLPPPPARLRPAARGVDAVPAVGIEDPWPSRVRADAGSRGDDRAARPGLRERRRQGHRRTAPRL